jgi:hypothetical protein
MNTALTGEDIVFIVIIVCLTVAFAIITNRRPWE